MVLIVVCCTTGLIAQAPQPSGGSTPFFPVPTGPATPTAYTADMNSTGTHYPETRPAAVENGFIPNPEQYQPIPATNGTTHPPAVLEPERPLFFEEAWTWQYLPDGILYKSYLAGGREPRFGSQWVNEKNAGWLWDVTLGGRVGILRYGTMNSSWPEGWQIDLEGAAFPRLNLENERDLDAVDFRAGVPFTIQRGPWQAKFGYYHLSSHLGDEFMVRNNTLDRINYVRETLVYGVGWFFNPNLRLYSEAGYAFYTDGGSKPWEFQFGIDYSPIEPTCQSPAPFFAINGRIREEVDYGGNMTVQTGLQWRGRTGRLMRIGLHYFNGMSDMAQFLHEHEEQIGFGMWYDF
jgi:hypothetical protein